jgi:hypothetical protein
MPTPHRIASIAVLALALVALSPGAGLAADPTVSGTVTRDGAPVQGAQVGVLVEGDDMVWPATTDANGGWSVAADIAVGQKLRISATGPVSQSSPDPQGCVAYVAASGSAEVTVDVVPVGPVAITLDHPISTRVCSATASPRVAPTPPATDAGATGPGNRWATPVLAILLGLGALLAVGPLARRPARRR